VADLRAAVGRVPRPGTVGLEQRLLTRHRALPIERKTPLIVAFSGGTDSLALAAALARLRPSLAREVVAVHVDHGLRPESAREVDRARRLAEQIDLPILVERLRPGLTYLHPGVGVEEAARRERYLALARRAGEIGANTIAVAHQRDDQVESVLLHLLRGAGLTGARAMAELAEYEIPWWENADRATRELLIWRPFLAESRRKLAGYLAVLGLEPIDDPSNATAAFRRNRIRHAILPALEDEVPGAAEALARFGGLIAADDDALEDLAAGLLREATDGTPGALTIDPLLSYHEAIQRRAIRRWLTSALPSVEISADRVDAVVRLARYRRGRRVVEVGDGASVELNDRRLKVRMEERAGKSASAGR
jgi:tRNA(Ile)-lysidine synthetase-like protein